MPVLPEGADRRGLQGLPNAEAEVIRVAVAVLAVSATALLLLAAGFGAGRIYESLRQGRRPIRFPILRPGGRTRTASEVLDDERRQSAAAVRKTLDPNLRRH